MGTADGGLLTQIRRELEVCALPGAIPEKIEADVTHLKIADGAPHQRHEAARGRDGEDATSTTPSRSSRAPEKEEAGPAAAAAAAPAAAAAAARRRPAAGGGQGGAPGAAAKAAAAKAPAKK